VVQSGFRKGEEKGDHLFQAGSQLDAFPY